MLSVSVKQTRSMKKYLMKKNMTAFSLDVFMNFTNCGAHFKSLFL